MSEIEDDATAAVAASVRDVDAAVVAVLEEIRTGGLAVTGAAALRRASDLWAIEHAGSEESELLPEVDESLTDSATTVADFIYDNQLPVASASLLREATWRSWNVAP